MRFSIGRRYQDRGMGDYGSVASGARSRGSCVVLQVGYRSAQDRERVMGGA